MCHGDKPVINGDQQGNVLDPILFPLYINDLGDAVTEGTIFRFCVDDARIMKHIVYIAADDPLLHYL